MVRERSILLGMAMFCLLVAGCAAYEHKAPLDESRGSLSGPGTASITGTVTVKIRTGESKLAAESTVYLLPETEYSREWFQHYIVKGERISGKDPRSFASTRAAPVDQEGHFEFRNVSSGSYYLTCAVQIQRTPLRVGRLNFGMRSPQRVEAYAEVKVEPEQQLEIAVTRRQE